jgi:hypothetical protein
MWYPTDVIIVGLFIVIILMLARPTQQPRSLSKDLILNEEIKITPPPKPAECIRCGSAIYPDRKNTDKPTARIYCRKCP